MIPEKLSQLQRIVGKLEKTYQKWEADYLAEKKNGVDTPQAKKLKDKFLEHFQKWEKFFFSHLDDLYNKNSQPSKTTQDSLEKKSDK